MSEAQPRGRALGWSILALILTLLVTAYVLVYQRKLAEDSATAPRAFDAAGTKQPGHIEIKVTVTNVDPLKGDMVMRLEFTPKGADLDEDGVSVGKNVTMNVNNATGKAEVSFKKGEAMNPIDVTLRLADGSINDYPNDTYKASLQLLMSSGSIEDGWDQAPIAVTWQGVVPGYLLGATEGRLGKDYETRTDMCNVDMTIERSFTSILFAMFLLTLIWLLALAAMLVAISVCVLGRKVELPFFQWLATLLFALLPLRNGMPGAPPIGAMPDYTTFFWAETVVALSLVAIVTTWLARKPA